MTIFNIDRVYVPQQIPFAPGYIDAVDYLYRVCAFIWVVKYGVGTENHLEGTRIISAVISFMMFIGYRFVRIDQ